MHIEGDLTAKYLSGHFFVFPPIIWRLRIKDVTLQARKNTLNGESKMKTGDNVMISPDVTHKSDWTQGTVIDVEANPFVGTVISAETPSGEIYFEKECLFKLAI